jgi:hypothetical protein
VRTTRTVSAYVEAGLWALERLAPAAHKRVLADRSVQLFRTLEEGDLSEDAEEVRSEARGVVDRGLEWAGFRYRMRWVSDSSVVCLVFGPAGSLCIRDYSDGLVV